MPPTGITPMIDRLERERDEVITFVERTAEQAAERDLSDTERQGLETSRARVAELDAQLEPLRAMDSLAAASRAASADYRPTSPADEPRNLGHGRTEPRPHEYRSAGEFLADASLATGRGIDSERAERALSRLEAAGVTVVNETLVRADQTSADTPGILPENVVGQLLNDIDASRPFMASVGVKPLGGIPGKTFHRPVVTQSTQAGEQSAEKAALPSRKMVIGDVDFTKRTFGGYVDISRQDIDWTSPSAWDAVVTDLADQYAVETENAAADDFATAVTTNVTLGTSTSLAASNVKELATALFAAATAVYGVNKSLAGLKIWAALDVWAAIGPILVDLVAAGGQGFGTGGQSLNFSGGALLGTEQVVVPSFANGTLIIGPATKTEVYEERIGLLSVVEPKLLGVEVAYGGYMANGTLKPTAFRKIIPHA